jgi:hypothetical protein
VDAVIIREENEPLIVASSGYSADGDRQSMKDLRRLYAGARPAT